MGDWRIIDEMWKKLLTFDNKTVYNGYSNSGYFISTIIKMWTATLFAKYKFIGEKMWTATLLARYKYAGEKMLIIKNMGSKKLDPIFP